MTAQRARAIEDIGFGVAIALIALRGLLELVHESGLVIPPEHHGFPWGFAASVVLIIAPKYLGRITAGEVWKSIGSGIGKLVGRGKPGGDE